MQTSFYTVGELKKLGLSSIGDNVFISKKCSIYSPEKINIGNNVRIDDFCILSGKINIGNYVHIAAYCGLFAGDAGIDIGDYSTTSSRCSIYAISDDYSGEYMTNPMVPNDYRNVTEKKVVIKEHVIVGSGCTILPAVEIGEGVGIGSMSLVNKSLNPWKICFGRPCREVKDRSKELLKSDFLKKNILHKDKRI